MDITLVIGDERKLIQVNSNSASDLLEILRDEGVNIVSDCGGNGTCGKCKVQLIELDKSALACEISRDWLLENDSLTIGVDVSSYERAKIELGYDKSVLDSSNLTHMSMAGDSNFVLAIDIGTTTLAFALVDISTGNVVRSHGMINSQRTFGADVISRIKEASAGKLSDLRKCIIDDLISGIDRICTDNGTLYSDVKAITIAGNTTMCHVLMGYSCDSIGSFPYTPVNIDTISTSTKKLLGASYDIPIIIPPGITTYVGADITAGLIATNMLPTNLPSVDMHAKENGISLLIDLGTNGEMVLGDISKLLVTSTAAGPAFEGGNITCGVPSVDGAISHVSIDSSTKRASIETIGKKEPIGICGSGVLDTIASLLRCGLVDESGLLIDKYFESGYALFGDIVLTQEDIRQFQLAKSAIRTGLDILIEEYGIDYMDISNLYLAGGFGRGIDINNAVNVGLIPDELKAVSKSIGNSSLAGAISIAKMAGKCILDDELNSLYNTLDKVELALKNATEIDLSNHPRFKDEYLKNTYFK